MWPKGQNSLASQGEKDVGYVAIVAKIDRTLKFEFKLFKFKF